MIRLRLVDMADPTDSKGLAFAEPPWLVVTSGDLVLMDSDRAATQSAQGRMVTNDQASVEWDVWMPSTRPSTLEIRGSHDGDMLIPAEAANGPRINIDAVRTARDLGLQIESPIRPGGPPVAMALVQVGVTVRPM